mgnify:CR=1 FL=1
MFRLAGDQWLGTTALGWSGAGQPLDRPEHLFDTGRVEYVNPPPPWEAGRQGIVNSTGARVPEHTFGQPVPVVVRIVWEHDGEEHIETVALGWTGQHAYIRLPDPRYRFTAVWLDASDVKRINPS